MQGKRNGNWRVLRRQGGGEFPWVLEKRVLQRPQCSVTGCPGGRMDLVTGTCIRCGEPILAPVGTWQAVGGFPTEDWAQWALGLAEKHGLEVVA